MPDVEITTTVSANVDVWCANCGAPMCRYTSVDSGPTGTTAFRVEPCQKCLREARDEGYDEGVSAGEAVGYDKGYSDAADAIQEAQER